MNAFKSLVRTSISHVAPIVVLKRPRRNHAYPSDATLLQASALPIEKGKPLDLARPRSAASDRSRAGGVKPLPIAATTVSNITGDSYDGVIVNDVVVLFKRDLSATFTGVTFIEPRKVAKHFVTGLIPGVQYAVAISTRDNATRITIIKGVVAGAEWYIADAEGVLAF